jgi:hypothetical protein
MRKISILNEDFMALEQKVAEAIDNANRTVESAKTDIKGKLMEVCSKVQDESNFHKHPEFINFKAEFNFPAVMKDIKDKIINAINVSKDLKIIPVEKSAVISASYNDLHGGLKGQLANDVEEVVSFFGLPNTNIPESETNDFRVVVTDDGRKESIKKLGTIREMFENLEATVNKAIETGDSKQAMMDAMDKIVVIKELVSSY